MGSLSSLFTKATKADTPGRNSSLWLGRDTTPQIPCKGFFLETCELVDQTGKRWKTFTKQLINDLHVGVDEFKASWYAEPHAKVTHNGILYHGTFRSTTCAGFTNSSPPINFALAATTSSDSNRSESGCIWGVKGRGQTKQDLNFSTEKNWSRETEIRTCRMKSWRQSYF